MGAVEEGADSDERVEGGAEAGAEEEGRQDYVDGWEEEEGRSGEHVQAGERRAEGAGFGAAGYVEGFCGQALTEVLL